MVTKFISLLLSILENLIGESSLALYSQQFLWKHEENGGKWTSCSVTCGEGITESLLHCYDALNELRVENSKCRDQHKPLLQKKCFKPPCKVRKYKGYWFETDWGDCSSKCGRGVQSRLVACINLAGTEILTDKNCPLPKPKEHKECSKKKCNVQAKWTSGPWTKCSAPCDGKRTRKIYCKNKNGKLMNYDYCVASGKKEPAAVEMCGMPCHRWVAGDWGRCKFNKRKKTCSQAKQSRCVLCIDTITFRKSKKCSDKTKPLSTKSCAKVACRNIITTTIATKI